jgi:Cd(II)/Pb(II)-responsive transcriptional regulator
VIVIVRREVAVARTSAVLDGIARPRRPVLGIHVDVDDRGSRAELEAQAAGDGQWLQSATYHAYMGRAVHGRDAKHRQSRSRGFEDTSFGSPATGDPVPDSRFVDGLRGRIHPRIGNPVPSAESSAYTFGLISRCAIAMKIGELAEATGTQIETIHFYERARLLTAPARSGGNYRIYEEAHVQRLSFIRRCRSLDMNLEEIHVLLRFRDAPAENCSEVSDLLDGHIGHVAARMRELRKLDKDLRSLRDLCAVARDAGHCGILNELSSVARSAASQAASRVGQVHGTSAKQRSSRQTVSAK